MGVLVASLAFYAASGGFAVVLVRRTVRFLGVRSGEVPLGTALWSTFAAALVLVPMHGLAVASTVSGAGLVQPVALVPVALGYAAGAWRWWLPRTPRASGAEGPVADPFLRLALVAGAGAFALVTAVALLLPPQGWDGLVYHLPLAVAWARAGNLDLLTSDLWRFAMPSNGEAFLVPLYQCGAERLVAAFHAFVAFLLLLETHDLARTCGASRAAARWVTLLVLSLPMVLMHVWIANVDLQTLLFLLVTLHLLLVATGREGLRGAQVAFLTSCAGLAFGLAVGTKLLALLAAPLVFLQAVMAVRTRRLGARAVVPALAGLVLASGVGCGTWFARNAVFTGNPLYPISLEGIGFTAGVPSAAIEAGAVTAADVERLAPVHDHWVAQRWHWWVYPWLESKSRGVHLDTDAGLGLAFAAFVPVAFLAALFGVLRPQRLRGTSTVLLGVPIAWAALWWFVSAHQPRFLLLAFVLLAIHVAALLDGVRAPDIHRALRVLLTTCLLATFGMQLLLNAAPRIGFDVAARFADRTHHYGLPRAFAALPRDAVVLNACRDTLNYPLHGAHLAHRVVSFSDLVFREEMERTAHEIRPAFLTRHGITHVLLSPELAPFHLAPSVPVEVLGTTTWNDVERVLLRVDL